MNQVDKCRRTEISIASGNALGDDTYLLRYKLLHFGKLLFEVFHKLRIGLIFIDVLNSAHNRLIHHLSVAQCECYLNVARSHSICSRVGKHHILVCRVLNNLIFEHVIVSEKHDVESRHASSHLKRSIFGKTFHRFAYVLTGMEKSDNQVGFLVLFDVRNPLRSAFHHILEVKATPQVLGEPSRDGRSNQAKNSHLHAIALKNNIRLKVRLTRSFFNGVGTDERAIALRNQAVVDFVPRLDIVIADVGDIVFQIIENRSAEVSARGVDEIVVISSGLALQHIAIVEKNKILAVSLAFLLNERSHTSHTAFPLRPSDKIIRETIAVNIGGVHHFNLHCAFFCKTGGCNR